MKIGIVVPIHNRPGYLKNCLWSLERVKLPKDTVILLINDASTDQQAIDLFNNFNHPTALIQRDIFQTNQGIRGALLHGYETLFGIFKCDLVINFDSDAVIRPDAVQKLIECYIAGTLLTGFHCITKNANGSERHRILEDNLLKAVFENNIVKSASCNLYLKESVGGINLCADSFAYYKHIEPALQKIGNWDHNACINARGAFSLKESVVQHIGFESSMNHNEQPDVADDFYYWHLPDVTLIGIDNQVERLVKAKEKCTAFIKFGEVMLLHPPIYSKESYSEFCIKELYKHIHTSHMLIFQHDGFVNDWKAWDNDWLQYDYIGAPWHYTDGMAVGNGGFSLRSKRLMEILATDPEIKFTHPEDHHICRTYRPYLEKKYKIKFAPADVAEKFSFEGYLQPHKRLDGQFGVHGMGMNTKVGYTPPVKVRESYVVNQYRGLGDVLFLIPLIRELMNEGNKVIWPLAPEYVSIAQHFPDIDFRDMRTVPVDYNQTKMVGTQFGKLLPYRFASENLSVGFKEMMRAKYDLYGHSYLIWRNLYWNRFKEREEALKQAVGATGEYVVINPHFGEPARGMQSSINYQGPHKVIEMKMIDGYSLIDWLGVIEGAVECHVANSSIMYLLELMYHTNKIYVYKRRIFQEQAFEHTSYLWTNEAFIFEQ